MHHLVYLHALHLLKGLNHFYEKINKREKICLASSKGNLLIVPSCSPNI